jgi:hypothetical protein
MPPEAACHKTEVFGATMDAYTLGAILFQVLVGRPPHAGRTLVELLRAAASNVIVETICKDALLPVAMKAMSTELKDRYQTVDDLLSALDAIEGELTFVSIFSMPTVQEPAWREFWWAGRR